MSKTEIDEEKILLMTGACKRRVHSHWIIPSKSRPYYEDERRVLCSIDESPEGLYPSIILPKHLLDKPVLVIPEENLERFLRLMGINKGGEKNG